MVMITPVAFWVTVGIVFAVMSLVWVWIFLTHQKLRTFFRGRSGSDLESVIHETAAALQSLQKRQKWREEHILLLSNNMQRTVQYVGIVRFNPFGREGSDQSFSIALLDGEQSGVALSSFYSRDGVRVYAKPLIKGKSPYPLTAEEEEAITRAVSSANSNSQIRNSR